MSDKLQFVVYFGQSLSRGNDKLKFIGHRIQSAHSKANAPKTIGYAVGKLLECEVMGWEFRETVLEESLMRMCAQRTLAQFFGHPNQFRQRVCPHFLHNLATMNVHCFLADAKFGGNLFVKQSSND